MKKSQTYDQEFIDKVVKEYSEVKNLTLVGAKNNVPITTLRNWVQKTHPKKVAEKFEKKKAIQLQKENHELKVEVEILKELLKKTNHLWLKE